MFGPHSRMLAAGRIVGAVLAVGLLATACGGSASTTASSAGAAVSSAASAVGSAADAAGSKLSSAADKATSAAASVADKATSAAASAASAASSKVSSAVGGAATGPAEVTTATTSLGVVLVGGNGMTLYMYDPDTGGVPTCYDQCAVAWPPLLTTGDPTAAGDADSTLLKTVARTDGTTQAVYGDWPLYFWQKDAAPGDVTGQGVQNVWWVVGVDGQPIKTAP